MKSRFRALATLVVLALVVVALGCGGRRGGRVAVDSGTPGTDGGAPDGGGRDGGTTPDSGGFDAGTTDAGTTDAGTTDAGAPTVDVSGSWTGTWTSSGLSDSATATLFQMGSSVAGVLSLSGSPCVTEGTVEAEIMGSDVAGTFSDGSGSASFTATATASTLVGSFTVDSGVCDGTVGTIDLSR